MAALCSGVEAEDQPTCVVLEGGPCSPCKERAAIRHQFKQLKAKYDTVGAETNAIHDPFIHKLPPEIASHILRLSLPVLNNEKDDPKAIHGRWSVIRKEWAAPLKLGSVCRKWRQLAWATPNLWTTLYIRIKPSMTPSTAGLLPALLHEWLCRSGGLPLTIYFFPYHDFTNFVTEDDVPDYISTWPDRLDIAATLVIDILNLHSGRWHNLHLKASADIFQRFSGSTEPKQLVSLELANTLVEDTPSLPTFMMESELSPTHLKLTHFPPISINIHWDNITHATLTVTNEEALDFLRRATSLEYFALMEVMYQYDMYDSPMIGIQTPILHPQLRSLHLTTPHSKNILNAINLPSLEKWTQDTCIDNLPLAAMLSFLKRSGCPLKLLTLDTVPRHSVDLSTLLQALPSLEHLCLRFRGGFKSTTVMDDILTRIFCSVPSSSDNLVDAVSLESFLPNLRFMECCTNWVPAPFSWDRIPQLYLEGHRQSLTLKCAARSSDISDETALQLLQLADKGLNLQIPDKTEDGDFLQKFRNRMREQRL
jgi:hypothetical protein